MYIQCLSSAVRSFVGFCCAESCIVSRRGGCRPCGGRLSVAQARGRRKRDGERGCLLSIRRRYDLHPAPSTTGSAAAGRLDIR